MKTKNTYKISRHIIKLLLYSSERKLSLFELRDEYHKNLS